MFESISRAAEQVATNVSRREFVGRLGRAAAGLAGVLGGSLLLSSDINAAQAAVKRCHGQICPPGYPYCCKEYDLVCRCNVWYCSATRC